MALYTWLRPFCDVVDFPGCTKFYLLSCLLNIFYFFSRSDQGLEQNFYFKHKDLKTMLKACSLKIKQTMYISSCIFSLFFLK